MEAAEKKEFIAVVTAVIRRNLQTDVFGWLKEKAKLIQEERGVAPLNLAFAMMPRKTGRHSLTLDNEEQRIIEGIQEGFSINDWAIDRLCRVWLLMQVNSSDKTSYHAKIENLFNAAEMNELAALYSSLYFLDYQEEWQERCAEGIRSNIGIVLEAIMYNNPYPFKNLVDLAWNQLVMKAFFTEKDVNRIIGLDERANKELALILIDYANERWAAHRTVNPQLWRLVAKFIDETNFKNIEKAFKSSDIRERKAAALACFQSNYFPARKLVDEAADLNEAIIENKISWNSL